MKYLMLAAVLVVAGCGTTVTTVESVCQTTKNTILGVPYSWNEVCEGTGSSEGDGEVNPPVVRPVQ